MAKRNTNKLTAAQVKAAHPREKTYRLSDGAGLNLTIKPSGTKLWQVRYRSNGRENTASLGIYPEITLAVARDRLKEVRRTLGQRLDPNRLRKQKRELNTHTFEAVAREWYERSRHKWKSLKHSAMVIGSLEKWVFPHIGNLPMADVTTADVWGCVEKVIGKPGRYETASRVLQRIGKVFTYTITLRKDLEVKTNPTLGVSEFIEKPPHRRDLHHPALEAKDMPQFLGDYAKAGVTQQVRTATRLLMLTAVRTSELIEASWTEFDLDARLWVIPAARMKKHRDHVVPLSSQAMDALAQAKVHSGRSALVFPGRGSMKKPISNNTVLFSIYKAGYRGRMTGHGFRSVFSTHLYSLNTFNPDAIELQLAHVPGNKVKAAYDRNQHIEERIRIMDYWGAVCASWADPEGNVVPFPREGRASG